LLNIALQPIFSRPIALHPGHRIRFREEFAMNHVSKQLTQANRAGMEAFETMAVAAFGALERMAALNLGAARNLLEQRGSNSRRMLTATDPQSVMSLHAG
jgi:hypothetical protein